MMKLDRETLSRMLALSDGQLKFLITGIAKQAGMSIPDDMLTEKALANLRRTIEGADETELAHLADDIRARLDKERPLA